MQHTIKSITLEDLRQGSNQVLKRVYEENRDKFLNFAKRYNLSDEENIDEAVFYNKNLFPKFFAEANNRLAKDGKLVVFFSNSAEIKNLTKEHPIEKELAKGVRFKLEKCLKKTIKPSVDKTKRGKKPIVAEEAQVWILVKK